MPSESVRTSLDIPRDLHRRLHEAALKKGCSARQLILQSIEHAVLDSEQQRPKKHLSLNPPIVPYTGKPFALTNDEIYDLLEFP